MTDSEHVDAHEALTDDGMDYRLDFELTYARDDREMDEWLDVVPARQLNDPVVPVRRVKDPHPPTSGPTHRPARRPARPRRSHEH